MVRHRPNTDQQMMEVDDDKNEEFSKLKRNESTLSGPISGKLVTEKQLIRDCIFVMQNINGHYIKWNEHNHKYELVPHVKCRDSNKID